MATQHRKKDVGAAVSRLAHVDLPLIHINDMLGVNLSIDLCANSEPSLMSAGGHISLLGWHHFTHGLSNTAQLGSPAII